MRQLVICLSLFSWLKPDPHAIEWLREQLKKEIPNTNPIDLEPITQPCKTCFLGGSFTMEPNIYVFMSFSIPNETWLALSKEMEKTAAVFVLNGVPQNSFQKFAHRVIALKEKGMNVDIQINPKLFQQYNIHEVPTFVVRSDQKEANKILNISVSPKAETYDIIKGNISLEYALIYIQSRSE